MAQFKVGDKVRVKTEEPFHSEMTEAEGEVVQRRSLNEIYTVHVFIRGIGAVAFKESEVFPIESSTLTITATLTTETIPTELIKQLSEAGFLITIKGI